MDEKQVVEIGIERHILKAGKSGVLHESEAWRSYQTGCGCAVNTLNSRAIIQKDLDRLEE